MKSWLKLLITGVIIFFIGTFLVFSYGGINTPTGSGGVVLGFIGLVMIGFAILTVISRGFRRMMKE